MKCRHRDTREWSFLKLGVWGSFRRCLDCKEVVPLGSSNDESVRFEILAAEVAAAYSEDPEHLTRQYGDGAITIALFRAASCMECDPFIGSFRDGWLDDLSHGHRLVICGDASKVEMSVAAGALARAIYFHDKEHG